MRDSFEAGMDLWMEIIYSGVFCLFVCAFVQMGRDQLEKIEGDSLHGEHNSDSDDNKDNENGSNYTRRI